MNSYQGKNPNQLTCDLGGYYCKQRIVFANVEVLYLELQKCANISKQIYLSNLEKLIQRIKCIKNLKQLILDVDITHQDLDHIRERIIDFLKNEIVLKHKQTIEFLHFRSFRIFSQKSLQKDQEQRFTELSSFITSNLKHIEGVIVEASSSTKSENGLILEKLLDVLSKDYKEFPKLQYFKLEIDSPFQSQDFKFHQQKQDLPSFLINSSNKISKIESLTKLEMIINNIGVDGMVEQKIINNLLNLPNLESLGIDISKNKQTSKESISFVKLISQKKPNLKEITFIDDQNLSSTKDIEEFTQCLKNFLNLKRIQFEGFTLKKPKQLQFLTYLQYLPNLTQILLDLSEFEMIKDNFNMLFKQLQIFNSIEVLRLSFPQINDFRRENTQIISNFLESQSQTLKDLYLSFYSSTIDFSPFYSVFSKLQQLKIVCFQIITKSNSISFSIETQSNFKKTNGAKTIFDLEHFETQVLYGDRSQFQYITEQIKFKLLLLKLSIIQEAKNIKSLEIQEFCFYQCNDDETKMLQKLQSFNKIEELSILNVQGTNMIMRLIKNNSKTLKCLAIDLQNCFYYNQPYTHRNEIQENEEIDEDLLDGEQFQRDNHFEREEQIYKRVLECINLNQLWVFQARLNYYISLQRILSLMNNLSSLYISTTYYLVTKQDQQAVINSSSLTKLNNLNYYHYIHFRESENPQQLQPLSDLANTRMAQIQQIFVYNQMISFNLNVNPLHCIWDLFL